MYINDSALMFYLRAFGRSRYAARNKEAAMLSRTKRDTLRSLAVTSCQSTVHSAPIEKCEIWQRDGFSLETYLQLTNKGSAVIA